MFDNSSLATHLRFYSIYCCKCVCVLVIHSSPTLCNPMNRLLCPWDSQGKNTEVGCHSLSRGFPDPGIEPRSPELQADSLPYEPPG